MKALAVLGALLVWAGCRLGEAAMPVDGHFQGSTSQGNTISFDVTGGTISNLGHGLNACSGLGQGFGFGSGAAVALPEGFAWSFGLTLGPTGDILAVQPGIYELIYGFADFTTPTHAAGQIWHALPFFTGNGLDISFCFDLSITFTADRTGPVAAGPEAPAGAGPDTTVRTIESCSATVSETQKRPSSGSADDFRRRPKVR